MNGIKGFFLGIIDFLEWFDTIRDKFEASLINFAAGIIPYFSSLIPAYFVFIHLNDILFVPSFLSFVFAVVVEVLGFASINTFVTLYQYRQKYTSDRKLKGSVSPSFAIFSFVMYLAVIVLVNGVLGIVDAVNLAELYENWDNTGYILENLAQPIANTFSIFVLSLLTIPGAVVVVARTQHSEFIGASKPFSVSRSRSQPRKKETPSNVDKDEFSLTDNHRKLLDYLKANPTAFSNVSELSRQIDLSRPTLIKYRKELQENGYIRMKGNHVLEVKG